MEEEIPVLDTSILEDLKSLQVEGKQNILKSLFDLFMRDTPVRLDEVDAAVERGDGEAVRKIAHTLKGSSGNIGAQRMARVAALLEDQVQSEEISHASDLLSRLRQEYLRVQVVLWNKYPECFESPGPAPLKFPP